MMLAQLSYCSINHPIYDPHTLKNFSKSACIKCILILPTYLPTYQPTINRSIILPTCTYISTDRSIYPFIYIHFIFTHPSTHLLVSIHLPTLLPTIRPPAQLIHITKSLVYAKHKQNCYSKQVVFKQGQQIEV